MLDYAKEIIDKQAATIARLSAPVTPAEFHAAWDNENTNSHRESFNRVIKERLKKDQEESV